MALISRLGVILGLDSAEFSKGLGLAENSLNSFSKKVKIGLGAAVVAAGAEMVAAVKQATDYADTMSKTAQKIGVTTEALSALKYAAELSDVSFEGLQMGLKKLSVSMAGAVTGKKDMAAAFDTLKISVKNSTGELKTSDQVLYELADKFAKMPDGVAKTALAVKVLGKAGQELIPMLNGGSAELKRLQKEAEHFGLIVGTDFGKQAEAFNDNMERMSLAAQGLQIKFGNTLIPALSEVFEDMLKIEKEHGLFVAALYGIGDALDKAVFGSKDTQQRNKVKELNEDLVELQRRYATLTSAKSRNFYEVLGETGHESWIRAKMTMEHDIGELEGQIRALNREILARKNKSALPAVGRPDKETPALVDDSAQKLIDKLDQQVRKAEQEKEAIRGIVTESDKLNLSFEKGGEFYDVRNTKQAKHLKSLTKEIEIEKELYERQSERNLERAQMYEQINVAHHEQIIKTQILRAEQDKLAATAHHQAQVELEKTQYEKEIVNLSDTQTDKARQYLALRQKILDLSKDAANSEAYIAQVQADGIKQIEASEATKRAQNTFQAGWNKSFANFVEKSQDSAALGAEAFNTMASSMTNALDTFVSTGKLSFSDLINSMIKDLLRMALKAQVSGLFNMLGLGNLFGVGGGGYTPLPDFVPAFEGATAFADGGDPPVGVPSLVGERGPELFVPKTAGTIIPNHSLSSALGSQPQIVYNGTVIQNMNAIDTQSGVQFLSKNKDAIWAANQSANRSLPMSR